MRLKTIGIAIFIQTKNSKSQRIRENITNQKDNSIDVFDLK